MSNPLKVFGGGIPTEPDVNAYIKLHGMPKAGDVVSYTTLEALWNLKRKDSRFITLLGALRKRVLGDAMLFSRGVRGKGVEFLTPSGNVVLSNGKFKTGLKMVGKAGRIIGATDMTKLNPEERRVAEHIESTTGKLKLVAATAAKELPPIKH